MKYQLVVKTTGTIVTITDRKVFGLNEAKAYYIRMKQLKEKEFDKLYVVEEYKLPESLGGAKSSKIQGAFRQTEWWKEEPKKLDDF